MNRHRLNQILEILLFPVTDYQFGQENKDVLLQCYLAYHKFQKVNSSYRSGSNQKNRAKSEYYDRRKKLIAYLKERCQSRLKSEDDILMLIELYYPMNEIEQELGSADKLCLPLDYHSVYGINISKYYLKKMSCITASLITYRDGTAAIRQWVDHSNTIENDIFQSSSVYNKVEIWNLLCRITVPDLYIVIAAVDNQLGMEALYEQKSYIALADKLLSKVLQKGLAENHMHFNVGMDYEVIWLPYTDLGFLEDESYRAWKEESGRRLEVGLFRALAACYVEEGHYKDGFYEWMRRSFPEYMIEIISVIFEGGEIREVKENQIKGIIRFYQSLISDEAVREKDYLMGKVYAKYLEYKVSSEFIFLYQCYKYIINNAADVFFTRAFLQYVRLKNRFFYDRQESFGLQGLKYFQQKYNSMKAAAQGVMQKSDVMLEVFRFQSKINGLKKLEIRVAPNVGVNEVIELNHESAQKILQLKLYDQVYEILYAYRRYILECLLGVRETWELLKKEKGRKRITQDIDNIIHEQEKVQGISVPSLGIVFHFIKTEQLEDTSDIFCWRHVREKGKEIMPLRMSIRRFATDVAIALERIRSTVPGLDEYLVGIDAASDENAMEPWMFAQAYRIMRSHMYTKPVLRVRNRRENFHRIQNIAYTYHVGEDFRHIVSGFRHMDEVLEEFGYKAGDRLGHALALGIDVGQWAADNEVVPIPVLEHLENLLWMWGVNTCDGFNLSVRLELLEDKIMDIAERIYPNSHTITVKMLYQAYKKKFNIDHAAIATRLNENEDFSEADCRGFQKESAHSESGKCSECMKIFCNRWNSDKLLMTNYCQKFMQKYEQVELIPVTKDEIEVYLKLQGYLMRKVERKGIYLEVNPTSNLTIGDFSQIKQHPIFKLSGLHESRENHVMVTINSDDPAVFNTNIENELAYIYYAAEELGYSKSESLDWIDCIRQQGMDASFVKHEKDTVQILMEIQDMMDCILKINM